MNFFDDWWSLGEDVINNKYRGMLKHGDFEDCMIYDEESFTNFKRQIESENNKEGEVFLNDKIKIDFNNEVLFVFSNCDIKQLLFNQIFQCYMIIFDENTDDIKQNSYIAVVAKLKRDEVPNYEVDPNTIGKEFKSKETKEEPKINIANFQLLNKKPKLILN